MNRHQELKEIKDLRNKLVYAMRVYSKDMEPVLTSLYQQTPTPLYDNDISEMNLPVTNPTEFMFKILKHMTSSDLKKNFTEYVKKRDFFNTNVIKFDELITRMSYLGRAINLSTYGDGYFIRTYLPDLDGTIYELLTVFLYSTKLSNEESTQLFINRFNYMLESIWDLHIVDEASKTRFLADYNRLNNQLKLDGFNDQIKGFGDVKRRYNLVSIKEMNTYIVAYLLVSEFLRDGYIFDNMLNEIHKSDNYNYEEVLDKLGINYIKHDDIIKLARLSKDDRHGKSFN